MAVALTIVMRIFGTGANSAMLAEDYTNAVQIAESLLARCGDEIDLQPGELQGEVNDKFSWRLTMRNVTPALPAPTAETEVFAWQLINVQARVDWDDGSQRPRSLLLSTMKLQRSSP